VLRTYTTHHSQNAWAVISGVTGGWKKVRTGAPDGVTNTFMVLSTAKANGRRVDAYIVGNQIERATLK
jgi:hypothetical protein